MFVIASSSRRCRCCTCSGVSRSAGGQLVDRPFERDPGERQAALEARAQAAEHAAEVAVERRHRVDHRAQLLDRQAHLGLQVAARRAVGRDHRQHARQLRSQAVVHVAHDALALFDHRMVEVGLGLFVVCLAQLDRL
jgi:hypothetical protein